MINTKENLHTLTEITLANHKTWSIEGGRRGDVISCLSGTLWITQENDLKDYILEQGKDFWVTKPGAVVVQALQSAQYKYTLNELKSHIEINPQPIHHSPRYRVSHLLR
jgi:hypothetical protein